jgi:hypothetical protein
MRNKSTKKKAVVKSLDENQLRRVVRKIISENYSDGGDYPPEDKEKYRDVYFQADRENQAKASHHLGKMIAALEDGVNQIDLYCHGCSVDLKNAVKNDVDACIDRLLDHYDESLRQKI